MKRRTIVVRVKPGVREEGVVSLGEGEFMVRVKEPAREGRANQAVLRVMSRHLRVPIGRLRLVRGERSRVKILEIF
jgi:uncharacterized protein (TIGR00251 family)